MSTDASIVTPIKLRPLKNNRAFYYIMSSEVPMLIAAAPMELCPEILLGVLVWRLLTNGGVIYVALGELKEKHYLDLATGMTGLPFGEITPWICEGLVAKHEGKEESERPEWMACENEDAFIKRIVELYLWHGKDMDGVNAALSKLFGKSGSSKLESTIS